MEHCIMFLKPERWEYGKITLKIYPNRWVEEKTMENWFKHRFPRNKVMRWMQSHLTASHCSDEARRLTGEVVMKKATNQCYYLYYDLKK